MALRRDGLATHTNRNPDQLQAERNMAKAGQKPPKLCECSSPMLEYDEDGFLWCHKCARHRR